MIGWARKLFGSSRKGPGDDFWYGPVGAMGVAAGVPVTPETALQVPEVLACLKVLSETVASLPLMIYRRRADGGRERADSHPLYDVLHSQPNERQTAFEFRGQMQWNLALHGNAYAEIVPGPRGPVDQLFPLHPTQVEPGRSGQTLFYEVRDLDTGRTRTLREDQVWHLRALPLTADGLTGIPPLESGKQAIGAALALQLYAARVFANDASSGGVFETEASFKTPEDQQKFLDAWKRARTGGNAHRDALLLPGMKYVRQTINNEQAQFIETRKELAYAIARIWRIPPHKIGILDRATNNNIEHQGLEFISDTLLPELTIWEQSSNMLILPAARRTYFVEFNVAGLLRGDLQARYTAYSQARQWGWMSVNDIRRLENMNPVEDGDVYLQPVNMAPAGSAPPQPQQTQPQRAEGFMRSPAGVWVPEVIEGGLHAA